MKNNLFSSSIIAISILLLFTLILPAFDKTRALFRTIEERKSILTEQENLLDQIQSLNKSIDNRIDEIGKLDTLLPKNKELPELIITLETTSSSSGLILSEIKFSELTVQGDIKKISGDIRLSGSFSSFLNFLKNIEDNIRIIDVMNINIALETGAGEQEINYGLRFEASKELDGY